MFRRRMCIRLRRGYGRLWRDMHRSELGSRQLRRLWKCVRWINPVLQPRNLHCVPAGQCELRFRLLQRPSLGQCQLRGVRCCLFLGYLLRGRSVRSVFGLHSGSPVLSQLLTAILFHLKRSQDKATPCVQPIADGQLRHLRRHGRSRGDGSNASSDRDRIDRLQSRSLGGATHPSKSPAIRHQQAESHDLDKLLVKA